MTVLAIILATALAGAIAFAATMAAFALRNARRAEDARVDASALRGDVAIAAIDLDKAADAITQANQARLRQTARADALEEEIHELENLSYVDPAALVGRARLRAALRDAAAAKAADGDHGDDPLPDAAAAEPASSPGD